MCASKERDRPMTDISHEMKKQSELEKLNQKLVEEASPAIAEIVGLRLVNRTLREENARLKSALEFYANISNWTHLKGKQADENPWGRPVINFDDLYPVEPCTEWGTYGGRRAREALKGSSDE